MLDFFFLTKWPWWLGGLALGLFVVLYTWVHSKLLGMSSTLEYAIAEIRQPLIPKAQPAMSMEDALLALAREQGLDPASLGIAVADKPAAETRQPIEFHPRMMVLGVFLGALAGSLLQGAELQLGMGPAFDALFPAGPIAQAAILLAGGFLIGFGARMAGGCPSGHALGGLSVMSPSSFIAIAGYFLTGIGLTFLLRFWML